MFNLNNRKMFTKEKKEKFIEFKAKFNEIYDELDDVIDRITIIKSQYGKYPFNYDCSTWEYDGELFEVECVEDGYGCGDDTHYCTVTWDEIFNVDELEEKLKKEHQERKKEEEIKKEKEKAQQAKREREAEKRLYEQLKKKYEKS